MWGAAAQLHTFLITALDWGQLPATHPGRCTPGEKGPGTRVIRAVWVPQQAWTQWKKDTCPSPGIVISHQVVQPVALSLYRPRCLCCYASCGSAHPMVQITEAWSNHRPTPIRWQDTRKCLNLVTPFWHLSSFHYASITLFWSESL